VPVSLDRSSCNTYYLQRSPVSICDVCGRTSLFSDALDAIMVLFGQQESPFAKKPSAYYQQI
jgi:hypothetical protein